MTMLVLNAMAYDEFHIKKKFIQQKDGSQTNVFLAFAFLIYL